EGIRSRGERPDRVGHRADGGAGRCARERAEPAAHADSALDGSALAPYRQEQPRAVRAEDAQARHRHHGLAAADDRRADEVGSPGRRGRGDQGRLRRRRMAAIIGRKLGMTQIFDESGAVVPVTVVEAGPCPVVQVKTVESDGYTAIQLGFGVKKESRATRAERGHARRAGLDYTPRTLREFRVESVEGYEPG